MSNKLQILERNNILLLLLLWRQFCHSVSILFLLRLLYILFCSVFFFPIVSVVATALLLCFIAALLFYRSTAPFLCCSVVLLLCCSLALLLC